MLIRSILLAGICSAFTLGCAGDGSEYGSEDDAQEIIDNLIQAGFPADDIRVYEGKVYVGNDAEVSLEASREMLESDSSEEQYRTNNLVGGGNPAIICVNGAAFTNGTLSAGLNLAIENYNQQFGVRSRLFFFRVNGGAVPGCTFFINGVILPGVVGGSAGFPSNGAPFGTINIGDGIVQFGVDVSEHVITHELGHCIGFRHSDFFNRSISCNGAPVNEEDPPSGLGAILIPGTPAGAVVGGSIMNSCFRTNETGEFTGSDITAIDVLY